MATRSLIWRTLGSRLPAARTGAERSASNRRAMERAGAGRLGCRFMGRSVDIAQAYGRARTCATVHASASCGPSQGTTLSTMSQLAFVFPGQGSQSVGMGRALADASPAASSVFAAADRALGTPISTLAWEGPAEQLD